MLTRPNRSVGPGVFDSTGGLSSEQLRSVQESRWCDYSKPNRFLSMTLFRLNRPNAWVSVVITPFTASCVYVMPFSLFFSGIGSRLFDASVFTFPHGLHFPFTDMSSSFPALWASNLLTNVFLTTQSFTAIGLCL
jgi:hypothetical protein